MSLPRRSGSRVAGAVGLLPQPRGFEGFGHRRVVAHAVDQAVPYSELTETNV